MSHHKNIDDEAPVFIHPSQDEAETFITFREEIPVAVGGNARGKAMIEKLGLDRELLNEQRRKTLNMINHIYNLAKGYPDTEPELKNSARNIVYTYFTSSESDETEYSSMLRVFFKHNPVDF